MRARLTDSREQLHQASDLLRHVTRAQELMHKAQQAQQANAPAFPDLEAVFSYHGEPPPPKRRLRVSLDSPPVWTILGILVFAAALYNLGRIDQMPQYFPLRDYESMLRHQYPRYGDTFMMDVMGSGTKTDCLLKDWLRSVDALPTQGN